MDLDRNSITCTPESIPQAGGVVQFFFGCSSDAPSRFTTLYSLPLNGPYRFAGGGLQMQIGPRPVTPAGNNYADSLSLSATGNPANTFNLQINVALQELDAAGNPKGAPERGSCQVLILHAAVAAFRATNNMSQSDLANRIGVARSTISRLEQGGNPSDETVEKLLSEMSKK